MHSTFRKQQFQENLHYTESPQSRYEAKYRNDPPPARGCASEAAGGPPWGQVQDTSDTWCTFYASKIPLLEIPKDVQCFYCNMKFLKGDTSHFHMQGAMPFTTRLRSVKEAQDTAFSLVFCYSVTCIRKCVQEPGRVSEESDYESTHEQHPPFGLFCFALLL